MDTLLHLGVWMLLSFELATGIICSQCQFQRPGSICLDRRHPCRLFVGQSCYKKTVYYGKVPLYSYQSCIPKCIELNEEPKELHLTQTVKCCSNRNFCNL